MELTLLEGLAPSFSGFKGQRIAVLPQGGKWWARWDLHPHPAD
jgi:hypothetical protein